MSICRREFGLALLAGLAAPAFGIGPRSKLLVLVLLEQLRGDAIANSGGYFGPGGFRRLAAKSAFFPDCRNLASTFPSSSIATVASGAWPAQHGIVADSWYAPRQKAVVRASESQLLATTLCAQIAAAPRTRVFTVGLDRESAALFAGTPLATLFSMDETGKFTSSAGVPNWLSDYNRLMPVENLHNAEWMALGALPGAPPLRTLTYDPSDPAEFLKLFKASPLGEEAQFGFAAELIAREQLGQGDTFDFLCILASSSALLGYEVGGASPLMRQMTLRLDRHLEYLLTTLDKVPGENNFSLVLTGAHGAPPEPADLSRPRMAIAGEALAQAVDRGLKEGNLGKVEKYVYPFLYLEPRAGADPETVRLAAARAAMNLPEVAAWFTAGGACSTWNEWERRFRNSFHASRSGDVMLSYQPEYVEDFGAGRGISYGSLYNYDSSVPLFFYGPQFAAGEYESPVESVDVAPTIARAIGVAAPSSSTGRVLGSAFGSKDIA